MRIGAVRDTGKRVVDNHAALRGISERMRDDLSQL